MGYLDLIQKRLETLSPERQAQVLAYVESLANAVPAPQVTNVAQRPKLLEAITAARGCLPHPLSDAELDAETAAMRAEWDRRGWEAAH